MFGGEREKLIGRGAVVRGGPESWAAFSVCGRYRWALVRSWDEIRPAVAFIGLNPSTADEFKNDPTVTRCINYARRWGFGSFVMLNLFGLRSTDPKLLKRVADPLGVDNDFAIGLFTAAAARSVAAWGVHGELFGRAAYVCKRVAVGSLWALGLTAGGVPRHPLYMRSDLTGFLWWRGG